MIYIMIYVVFLVILLYVHEYGHYSAGRFAGIPKNKLKVIMKAFPPHVAIKNGEKYISPSQYTEYVNEYTKYDPKGKYATFFTGGGFLSETLFIITATLFLVYFFDHNIAFILIAAALIFDFYYLLTSIIIIRTKRVPWGDWAGLWKITRLGTVVFFIVHFSIRIFLFVYLLPNVNLI